MTEIPDWAELFKEDIAKLDRRLLEIRRNTEQWANDCREAAQRFEEQYAAQMKSAGQPWRDQFERMSKEAEQSFAAQLKQAQTASQGALDHLERMLKGPK